MFKSWTGSFKNKEKCVLILRHRGLNWEIVKSSNVYVFVILTYFWSQGLTGPIGPPGPSGPNGEKVNVFLVMDTP